MTDNDREIELAMDASRDHLYVAYVAAHSERKYLRRRVSALEAEVLRLKCEIREMAETGDYGMTALGFAPKVVK